MSIIRLHRPLSDAYPQPSKAETSAETVHDLRHVTDVLERLRVRMVERTRDGSCALAPRAQTAMNDLLRRIDILLAGVDAPVDPTSPGDPESLSPREQEILEWIARGKSNTVIAEILGISPHTVDTHIRRIFRKLDAADRTNAVVKAIEGGFRPAV